MRWVDTQCSVTGAAHDLALTTFIVIQGFFCDNQSPANSSLRIVLNKAILYLGCVRSQLKLALTFLQSKFCCFRLLFLPW